MPEGTKSTPHGAERELAQTPEDGLRAELATGRTVAATPTQVPASHDIAPQTAAIDTDTDERVEPPRVRPAFIAGLTLATFGVMMALILPSAFSLSVVLERIAPGQEQILGALAASGAFAGMLAGPALGVWSDRTRSRFGRRRPFLLGGLLVGLVGLVILGTAPNVAMLFVGWIVVQWGLGSTASALVNIQADRLPESQRGRVAGLTGFATMAAPIIGIGLAYAVVGDQFLLFVAPGVVAAILVLLFGLLVKDADTRGKQLEPLSLGSVAAKYVFNPRKHPAYAWNWLGRLVFYMGISASSIYTTFFFAQRLGMPVDEVAGIIAGVSLVGIVGGIVGGLGSGFLSDKLKRRRIFILTGAVLFAGGSAVVALSSDLLGLGAGLLITNLGIGVFAAVDQAIVLDVLPERDTDAGRYMALMSFSQGIPNVIAPLVAGVVILIGATDDAKNYTLLYLLAGAFALAGALIIHLKVKSVR